MVLSELPDSTRLPSGQNATENMGADRARIAARTGAQRA
jgi:hypothetical protein